MLKKKKNLSTTKGISNFREFIPPPHKKISKFVPIINLKPESCIN